MQLSRAADVDLFDPVVLDDTDLVWSSDRDTFFGNFAAVNHNTIPALRGGMALTLNVSMDEHFMAWMRPAAHPGVPPVSLASRSLERVFPAQCRLHLVRWLQSSALGCASSGRWAALAVLLPQCCADGLRKCVYRCAVILSLIHISEPTRPY